MKQVLEGSTQCFSLSIMHENANEAETCRETFKDLFHDIFQVSLHMDWRLKDC